MAKYVIKRVFLALITTFIILSLSFCLIKLLKPERSTSKVEQRIAFYEEQVRLGYYTSSKVELKDGQLVDLVTQSNGMVTYYYYVPVMQQYGRWLGNILFHWDWGVSEEIEPNVKATVIIGERLWTSMKINIVSVLISVPIGILLGIWAALKKNTMTDHIISTLVMVLISLPSFVLITFMMLLLCYNSNILPTQWANPTDPTSKKILSYVIPVFCLSLGSICGYCRFVRAELCEVMENDYLLLARTKGLTRKQAIMRHAMKNAMVPIFPSILAEFIGIMGGSMILENLYGIPGIGKLFITSLNAKDYNILFVDMAIFTTISLLAGVVLDLSYGFIDPRIRMGAKK